MLLHNTAALQGLFDLFETLSRFRLNFTQNLEQQQHIIHSDVILRQLHPIASTGPVEQQVDINSSIQPRQHALGALFAIKPAQSIDDWPIQFDIFDDFGSSLQLNHCNR